MSAAPRRRPGPERSGRRSARRAPEASSRRRERAVTHSTSTRPSRLEAGGSLVNRITAERLLVKSGTHALLAPDLCVLGSRLLPAAQWSVLRVRDAPCAPTLRRRPPFPAEGVVGWMSIRVFVFGSSGRLIARASAGWAEAGRGARRSWVARIARAVVSGAGEAHERPPATHRQGDAAIDPGAWRAGRVPRAASSSARDAEAPAQCPGSRRRPTRTTCATLAC